MQRTKASREPGPKPKRSNRRSAIQVIACVFSNYYYLSWRNFQVKFSLAGYLFLFYSFLYIFQSSHSENDDSDDSGNVLLR